jgi:FMN reductase
MSDRPPQVLLLIGSLRRPSYTAGLCGSIADALARNGCAPTLFDPRRDGLPMADSAYHKDPTKHPDPGVRKLVDAAGACDALVLATPVYHNGPSGVLKNLLDHLAFDQFAYKPVGLVSHGGNRTTQAVEQMRLWTRGLLGHATAVQVCTAREDFKDAGQEAGQDADPRVDAPAMEQRIARFVAELSVMIQVMAVARRALWR